MLWKRLAPAFDLSMLKTNAPHGAPGVSTAFPQRCWRLHSAQLDVLQFLLNTLCERCKDATLV